MAKKKEFKQDEFKATYSSRHKKGTIIEKLAKALDITRPVSAQDTIPIKNMYKDGMFELPNGKYSKSWHILDVNFNMESDDRKLAIFKAYQNIYNRFSDGVHIQISILNRYRNLEEYNKTILMPMKDDEMDKYRKEINDMLLEKEELGENEIEKGIYFTLTVDAPDAEAARKLFKPIEKDMADAIHAINKSKPKAMTINERCEVLYDIINSGREGEFLSEFLAEGELAEDYDMSKLRNEGLTPKDVISPSVFKFDKDAFRMGNKLGQILYIKKEFPSLITSNLLVDICTMKCTMAVSMHCDVISKNKAQKAIHNAEVNLNSQLAKAQKKAIQSGYDPELSTSKMQEQRDDLEELRKEVSRGSQKLVDTTIVIMHTAETMDELEKQKAQIEATCRAQSFAIGELSYGQEEGLMSSLPLGYNEVAVKRTLTSDAVACLLPFKAQELYNQNGIYYGVNLDTQRLLIYDRKAQKSSNAMVFGTTGSGKSFKTKEEMVQVFLNTDDDIYIIDPEGEYSGLVQSLGGSAIDFAAGRGVHINPFDMDEDFGADDEGVTTNPLVLKNSVIVSLFEIIMGGQLARSYTSIIDRCLGHIYEKWLETHDKADIPVMMDLYEDLLKQPEGEAKTLARALEQFSKGALDLLSGQTNVDTNNRLVSYNTLHLSNPALKDMALVACLNDIWNRIIENKKKGKYTWVYIDEFHLYLKSKSIMEFLLTIWRRARKFNGIPTGITQNASDLLSTQESAVILSNSDTVIILNQAENDRRLLTSQYWLSEAEVECIHNAPIGTGLLKVGDVVTGETIIPFTDKFNPSTELFQLMNTSSQAQVRAQQKRYS